ncbi:MAG: enoyl-CoA hydratase/isomerase family protein [Candidatus Obscuribacterales bacterium]|nr:enoyl-CoA hydratase/isomerase family protein [Cyanobacteria bacterium SZAS LIN-5]RTL35710.1 MAG: enoyl-CoA hydratase/isomerase family protein [Candidatus Melainabacteria bacterium]
MSSGLETSVDKHIGYIRLNRPEQHNAISKEMWLAIPQAMAALQNAGARCIIIHGEGDDFSSGANTAEAAQLKTYEEASDLWHAIRDCLHAVWKFDVPTIAMIHGVCFGGGCLLATACDLRVASEESMFAVPVAWLGLTLDDTTMMRLVTLVGPANAKKLLLTGDSINSAEAHRIGLINNVVPLSNLRSTADGLAKRITTNVPFSIASCKQAINRIMCEQPLCPEENDREVVSAFISETFQDKVKRKRPT